MDSKQKLKIKKNKTKDIKNEFKHILLKRLFDNFPATELRSKTSQQKAFTHNKYWVSYLEDENQNLLGFMLWWDFNQIRFIEYLFVEKDCRHNGIGSELLKSCIVMEIPIIIEVEKGSSVEEFYIKNGFKKNNFLYEPIPLQDGRTVEAYSIYSYKTTLDFTTFNFFEFIIHQEEYQF